MRTETVAPIGPWQVDTGTLVRCERHRNWCAYRVGDEARFLAVQILFLVWIVGGACQADSADGAQVDDGWTPSLQAVN